MRKQETRASCRFQFSADALGAAAVSWKRQVILDHVSIEAQVACIARQFGEQIGSAVRGRAVC